MHSFANVSRRSIKAEKLTDISLASLFNLDIYLLLATLLIERRSLSKANYISSNDKLTER
jgi:hypothetical protein